MDTATVAAWYCIAFHRAAILEPKLCGQNGQDCQISPCQAVPVIPVMNIIMCIISTPKSFSFLEWKLIERGFFIFIFYYISFITCNSGIVGCFLGAALQIGWTRFMLESLNMRRHGLYEALFMILCEIYTISMKTAVSINNLVNIWGTVYNIKGTF